MEESGANKHKEEGANPSHGMECEIIDPEESIISSSNHGGDMPPVPSTCDDAAGGVVRPIPSNTVTPRVASAVDGTGGMPPPP